MSAPWPFLSLRNKKASTYRLVVPETFLPVLLAEHTTAILCCSRYGLSFTVSKGPGLSQRMPRDVFSYRMISSAILSGNFPTLVPPNFCTIHPLGLSFRTSSLTMAEVTHSPHSRDEIYVVVGMFLCQSPMAFSGGLKTAQTRDAYMLLYFDVCLGSRDRPSNVRYRTRNGQMWRELRAADFMGHFEIKIATWQGCGVPNACS